MKNKKKMEQLRLKQNRRKLNTPHTTDTINATHSKTN